MATVFALRYVEKYNKTHGSELQFNHNDFLKDLEHELVRRRQVAPNPPAEDGLLVNCVIC